jgi:hypothetical protein
VPTVAGLLYPLTWLAGVPGTVAGRFTPSCRRRVASEPLGVTTVWLLLQRQPISCVDDRVLAPGETLSLLGHDGSVRVHRPLLECIEVSMHGLSTWSR